METDRERPHRSTSELFVCFTSRLSSSSMKLSSKSILSPSRSRDPPQISLSSSLSRRLKSNGSIKGGGGGQASPMFPTGGGGKRRGCGFENPEPSSPKVTCIGQVRVKTKKQGKKMRARSKRRGEASFRKGEQQVGVNSNANIGSANLNPDLTRQNSQGFQHHQNCLKHRNNQRWVHLPLTICEALREFSCFFPCRSSCMSTEKEEKGGGVEGGGHGMIMREGSCGINNNNNNNNNNNVGRWLVALQDGDGKGRGIELVMEEEMEVSGRERSVRSHSQRRHVFEDIDVDLVVGEEQEKKHEELVGEEEEQARVSICIPPKNALLLMRCRSDPVKMAALANRFWESPVHKDKCQEEQQDDEEEKQHHKMKDEQQEEALEQVEREAIEDSICERETETAVVATENDEEEQDGKESYEIVCRENLESQVFTEVVKEEEKVDEEEAANGGNAIEEGETLTHPEAYSDLENLKTEEKEANLEEGKEERENNDSSELSSTPETFAASEKENDGAEAETEPVTVETSEGSTEEEEEKVIEPKEQPQQPGPTREPNSDPESMERENGSKREERDREALPECLLLMMCEPKLSMEVSKETWVCSTDFIRWLPERTAAGGGNRVAAETLAKSKPKPKPMMQPPRSSCSFPAARGGAGVSMAAMIEQKLMGSKSGNGYEPFVLTRCKSEPMRSSAKLAPEACFWNNRKLEPHPPAAQLGVGAPAGDNGSPYLPFGLNSEWLEA
ncbi:hypothetical protein GmHk_13G038782 [Glycine max]|nr:hypothetical protein GmHk_13G038782 [Glycine max]